MAFVVQVCIKVVSRWLVGEMAWAIPAERVFDCWTVAETEVSLTPIIRTESRYTGNQQYRLHPMVMTWIICLDILGKDCGILGKYLIFCKLSANCWCCNIKWRQFRCEMPYTVSQWMLFWCSPTMTAMPKTLPLKFIDDMMIMELYPLSRAKRLSHWKKYRTFHKCPLKNHKSTLKLLKFNLL